MTFLPAPIPKIHSTMKPRTCRALRTFAEMTMDPLRAENTMKRMFKLSDKRVMTVSVVTLFENLIMKRVGTNAVESMAKRMRGGSR